jgi:hypothetical protein
VCASFDFMAILQRVFFYKFFHSIKVDGFLQVSQAMQGH